MSKPTFLTQVGITTTGIAVVSGVFRFVETYGLPLDIIFLLAQERNMMPCWVSFYVEATKAGMKHKNILSKLSEPMADTYGKPFADHVLGMLDKLNGHGEVAERLIAPGSNPGGV